jgi:hypothetical protein
MKVGITMNLTPKQRGFLTGKMVTALRELGLGDRITDSFRAAEAKLLDTLLADKRVFRTTAASSYDSPDPYKAGLDQMRAEHEAAHPTPRAKAPSTPTPPRPGDFTPPNPYAAALDDLRKARR